MKREIECRNCGGCGVMIIHSVGGKITLIDCGLCDGKGKEEVEVEDNREKNKTPIKKILENL